MLRPFSFCQKLNFKCHEGAISFHGIMSLLYDHSFSGLPVIVSFCRGVLVGWGETGGDPDKTNLISVPLTWAQHDGPSVVFITVKNTLMETSVQIVVCPSVIMFRWVFQSLELLPISFSPCSYKTLCFSVLSFVFSSGYISILYNMSNSFFGGLEAFSFPGVTWTVTVQILLLWIHPIFSVRWSS